MSKVDSLRDRLKTLEIKHRELDNVIQSCYTNVNTDDNVQRMKTLKLWYKDEIHRLNQQLIQMVLK